MHALGVCLVPVSIYFGGRTCKLESTSAKKVMTIIVIIITIVVSIIINIIVIILILVLPCIELGSSWSVIGSGRNWPALDVFILVTIPY